MLQQPQVCTAVVPDASIGDGGSGGNGSGQALQPLAQWQADRICVAAAAGDVAALTAALESAGGGSVLPPEVAANCRDSERCLTPLHWTSFGCSGGGGGGGGSGDCSALLLSRGANPNSRDAQGCSPLHYAIRYNCQPACLQLLACRRTRPDLRNRWGRTALMFAAWGDGRDRVELAKALLTAGAAVDVRDSRGRTALMWAALTGKAELLRLLLAAGADWHRRNGEGRTAGQLAEREGHAEAARMLAAVMEEALKSPPAAAAPSPGPEATKDGAVEGGGTSANAAV